MTFYMSVVGVSEVVIAHKSIVCATPVLCSVRKRRKKKDFSSGNLQK